MTSNWRENKVYENILQCIGNTPVVKLNRIPKDYGLECEMYAKCEFLNPGGSVKDRIAYSMVLDAEEKGRAKHGTRFVEPTSGNTGIAVALTAVVRGYECTIVTPDKNSAEKMSTMHLLGSEIIQTPSMAPHDDSDNYMNVAKRIVDEDPNAISLNQYSNEVNPDTHYEHTAQEILDALGPVDMFVMGTGTGGTVTGVARKLKEISPNCIVVTVDPAGSIIYGDGKPMLYYVEGIGGDFVPDVCDKTVVNDVVKTFDKESFNMSREMIRREGLLCGGSSGAITFSAIQAAKKFKMGPGKKVVLILPDGIRNYMTEFVTDQWMEAHLFKEPPQRDFLLWWNRSVSNLDFYRSVPTVNENDSCMDAITVMGPKNKVAFVTDVKGFLKGVVSKDSFRSEATNPKQKANFDFKEDVIKHLIKRPYQIIENQGNPTVGLASRILDITPFVTVVEQIRNANNNIIGYIPKGIITPDIVLEFIIDHQRHI